MKLSFTEFCFILFGEPLSIYRNISGSFENETYGRRDTTLLLCLFVVHIVQMTHKKYSDLGMGFKILGPFYI